MKIYLSGVEYKTYREIMQNLGVRFACVNYNYIWSRTPRFNLREECASFEELIALPGNLPECGYFDYQDFLNSNADLFSFALSPTPLHDCNVKILPCNEGNEYYITYGLMVRPFAPKRFKEAVNKGDIIHGVNFEMPWMASFNSATWMRGKAGLISRFEKNNKLRIYKQGYVRTAFARELAEEGYNINLDKVKRNEWKEVAKVNCIAWKKYQEWMETK
jgi:hypothetical protein